MNEIVENLRTFALGEAPRLVIAAAIMLGGWVVALAVGGMVRRTVARSRLGRRVTKAIVGGDETAQGEAARWAGRLTYYIIGLFVLVGLLQYVQLTAATEPIAVLLNSVFEFLPRLVAAALIFVFSLVLAMLIRKVVERALGRWGVDDLYAKQFGREAAGADSAANTTAEPDRFPPIEGTVAGAAYWLTLMLFVPAILGTLGLSGLLEPAQAMVAEILGYLPNFGSAALIFVLGWFVARVVQRLATHGLAAVGADRLGERLGLAGGKFAPSVVGGVIAYALVLVPVAVATLHALRLDAVTAPVSRMLETFLEAVPSLFGATLVLVMAFVVGRLLSASVQNILAGMGFDTVLARLGIASETLGERTPSGLAGGLVMLVVMVFALIEGARMLAMDTFADAATSVAVLGGHVLLGLAVFAVGMMVANLAAEAVRRSGVSQSRVLATAARFAILVLAAAVGLRQMGLANEIIELAFGIGFGAVAVAAALAFGLGGRDAAARTLEQFRGRVKAHREEGSAAAK